MYCIVYKTTHSLMSYIYTVLNFLFFSWEYYLKMITLGKYHKHFLDKINLRLKSK